MYRRQRQRQGGIFLTTATVLGFVLLFVWSNDVVVVVQGFVNLSPVPRSSISSSNLRNECAMRVDQQSDRSTRVSAPLTRTVSVDSNLILRAQGHRRTTRPIRTAIRTSSHFVGFASPFAASSLFRSALGTTTTSSTAQSVKSNENDINENSENDVENGLTPELQKITTAFAAVGDDKLRYKQLLYMANQLAPMDDAYKNPQYKVMGCLSNVYIHATVTPPTTTANDNINNMGKDNLLVYFTGDSDGLLTKGLVALLVRGLSGCTAAEIQKVNPQFIQTAGIQSSLTPGRNNGFLNMLAKMKELAWQVVAEATVEAQDKETNELEEANGQPENSNILDTEGKDNEDAPRRNGANRPKYQAMWQALSSKLQPVQFELIDVSYQHAGHAGFTGSDAESHFELMITSEAFQGLNLVKRHRLIYDVLKDVGVMSQIHALQITSARTPSEAGVVV